MSERRARRRPRRTRVGRVSVYQHRNSFWIYYREAGKPVRRRVSADHEDALVVAGEVNAQLMSGRRSMFSFEPVTVKELARRWIDHHEHVLASSLATVNRYRTAVEHLVRFASSTPAHEISLEAFVKYLRNATITPNGHANTAPRKILDKGIKFILTTCRSMFNYARKARLLPPYDDNPFHAMRIDRLPVENAKSVHIFTVDQETAFFAACDEWQLFVFAVLARTGLRPGELVHLLVEDIDFEAGILHIRNKPALGWQIKTRNIRSLPLPTLMVQLLKAVVRGRQAGIVFIRRSAGQKSDLVSRGCNYAQLAAEVNQRVKSRGETYGQHSRRELARICRQVWRDAGAIKETVLRIEFMKLTKSIGLAEVTAPKCWRHLYATLMQEAGVDPHIRQITLGHVATGSASGALGMTGTYTHTQIDFHRSQLERVLMLRPEFAALTQKYLKDNAVSDRSN